MISTTMIQTRTWISKRAEHCLYNDLRMYYQCILHCIDDGESDATRDEKHGNLSAGDNLETLKSLIGVEPGKHKVSMHNL